MDRRDFLGVALEGFVVALFAQRVSADELLNRGASATVRSWVAAHDDIARQLSAGRITGRAWQEEVERLASRVNAAELLAQIDFDRLERTIDLDQPGGSKRVVKLPHPDDPSRRLRFGTAIFGLRQRYAITPHAHRNMVSAHMVIRGQLHVRNFDRVGEERGHIIVEPTVDGVLRPGDLSTMSTELNNVHWFTALTPRAFTLDVVVDGLLPGEERYVIELLDVRNAQKVSNGRRRARIIDWQESLRLYGIEAEG